MHAGAAKWHRHSAVGPGNRPADSSAIHTGAAGGEGAVQAIPAAGPQPGREPAKAHHCMHHSPRAPKGTLLLARVHWHSGYNQIFNESIDVIFNAKLLQHKRGSIWNGNWSEYCYRAGAMLFFWCVLQRVVRKKKGRLKRAEEQGGARRAST